MAKKKAKKKVAKKNGRPTKYKVEYNEQAYKLCLLGSTDKQLADFFVISEATLNTWKHKHPKFLESLRKGKVIADANVAESLYERARGFSHPDTHISNFQGEITQTEITKHYPPDTAAAFIWLKNRAGWRDKQETEHTISEDTITLLGLIDGGTKGKLPDRQEEQDAR